MKGAIGKLQDDTVSLSLGLRRQQRTVSREIRSINRLRNRNDPAVEGGAGRDVELSLFQSSSNVLPALSIMHSL
jgi:hypothetical protein